MVNIPKVISDQVSGKKARTPIVMFSGLFELAFGYKWFAVKDSNPYTLEHQPSYETTRLVSSETTKIYLLPLFLKSQFFFFKYRREINNSSKTSNTKSEKKVERPAMSTASNMTQLCLKMFSKCCCRSDQIMFQIMTGDY
jgi:hypothetical protein